MLFIIKKAPNFFEAFESGRGDRIRTCDPLVPNQVRYRPALLPDIFSILGDPDRIRTCDLLLRRQLLYPAELRGLFLYRRCKNTTNFLEYIHFWNICVAQYIYDYFHQKENINSFFLQILHEIKFVRGLFFPSASNRKTHLIVI